MSIEEFEKLPMRPGWRYEYWDGRGHITPRENIVIAAIPVTTRHVNSPVALREVSTNDAAELTSAFLEAFLDSVEYCDWEAGEIIQAAEKAIQSHFAGHRGKPHVASRVATTFTNGHESIVGAALLTQAPRYPILDLLFVRPAWQRRGIATTLLSESMNELHNAGAMILKSAYHAANEASMNWHHRFGFVEEPDLLCARLHSSTARHELWRREKIGDLGNGERARLKADAEALEKEVERLEGIADRDGYEAVAPIMTWLK